MSFKVVSCCTVCMCMSSIIIPSQKLPSFILSSQCAPGFLTESCRNPTTEGRGLLHYPHRDLFGEGIKIAYLAQ